jgi:hypothetical protein
MNYSIVLLVTLAAVLLFVAFNGVTEGFVNQYQMTRNADRGGADIQCFTGGESAEVCRQKCDADPRCKSYNFVHPNSVWGGRSGCCYKTENTPVHPQNGIDFYSKLPDPPTPSSVSVVTLPEQRVPVLDGASGLHYSGRIYTNQFQQLSTDVCRTTASASQIRDVKPNSISTTALPSDPTTKRINQAALQAYVQSLIRNGRVPGQIPEFNKQMEADTAFYANVKSEYCFYEARYVAALNQFLTLVAAPNGADTSSALAATVELNKRLNSLLEVMNYVSNDRAEKVNDRSKKLNMSGNDLQKKIAVLQSQQDFLQKGDVTRKTHAEMLRFSAEKSQATNIQIMFFVVLNIVALGTVLTVYRQSSA